MVVIKWHKTKDSFTKCKKTEAKLLQFYSPNSDTCIFVFNGFNNNQ